LWRKRRHLWLVGIGLVTLFVLTIWRSDNDDHSLQLYNVWPAISTLPILLTIVVILKLSAATLAWSNAIHRGMVLPRSAGCYFAGWLVAVGILGAFFFILCQDTLWLRHLLMLAAILIVPLAGPALAVRALAANRSSL
jgi:hypothetical protein